MSVVWADGLGDSVPESNYRLDGFAIGERVRVKSGQWIGEEGVVEGVVVGFWGNGGNWLNVQFSSSPFSVSAERLFRTSEVEKA